MATGGSVFQWLRPYYKVFSALKKKKIENQTGNREVFVLITASSQAVRGSLTASLESLVALLAGPYKTGCCCSPAASSQSRGNNYFRSQKNEDQLRTYKIARQRDARPHWRGGVEMLTGYVQRLLEAPFPSDGQLDTFDL